MDFSSSFDQETKIWTGSERNEIFHPNISIGEVMLNVFSRDPKKIVQINDTTGKTFTCADIIKLSITLAINFVSKNLEQDKDVIGIMSKNTDYLLPVVYAAFIAGIPINSLDPLFSISDIMHMFGQTKPSLVFCDRQSYLIVKRAVDELDLNSPIYVLDEIVDDEIKNIKDFLATNAPNQLLMTYKAPKLINGGDHTAAIVCTSGTTGPPKGVCLSHRILIAATVSRFFSREDVILCFSSIYWLSGISFLIVSALTASCRIIVEETFSDVVALNLIEKYNVTILFATPFQTSTIVQSDIVEPNHLSSLQFILIGGSLCPVIIAEKLQQLLGNNAIILIVYGMTEAISIATVNVFKMKPGSAGRPYNGLQIKIVDSSTKEPLGPDEEGEICIRTGLKWKGYYKNEILTKQIYDNDEFIHTGDLGYVSSDGFLYIKGRTKEIFKYKNYQIYPGELESIISKIPGVVAVAIVGMYDANIVSDIIAAAVVKEENSDLTSEFIQDYVAETVSDFKKIRGGVYFLEQLPMTPSGKVVKEKVIELINTMRNSDI